METRILTVNAETPDPRAIAEAASVLNAGGLVAFPTETVYGLGANALDPRAVERVFEAKGRPSHNPLIVHVEDAARAQALAGKWPESAEALARAFWPGPLTLVVPKTDRVPAVVTGGGPTVALRVPEHPVALALIRAACVPVAAPSANRSNRVSPTRATHVLKQLAGRVEMLLDGGPTHRGVESTVISLAGPCPVLLRPGPVTPSRISAVIGRLDLDPALVSGAPLPSPGMMRRHYSPRAEMRIIGTDGLRAAETAARDGRRVGLLTCRAKPGACPDLLIRMMPRDPRNYARDLYAALHELDDLEVELILVEMPPGDDDWMAVRDRLHRAAAAG